MTYFSSGSEGLDFEERWCLQCAHWGRDKRSRDTGEPGCPVMDLHHFFNSEALVRKQEQDDSSLSVCLDSLIEPARWDDDGNTLAEETCTMFIPLPGVAS